MKITKYGHSPLKALRLEHNLTQEQLADKIGTTKVNISRWERGEIMPSLYYRHKLCELFEKSPYELGFLAINERDKPGTEQSDKHDLYQTSAITSPAQISSSSSPFTRIHFLSFHIFPRQWYFLILLIGVTFLFGGEPISSNLSNVRAQIPIRPAGSLLYVFHSLQGKDVFDVEWSSNSEHLVGVIGDGAAQLITAEKGKYIPSTTINAVNIATWSPDGKHIASANADDTVRIWNAKDGSPEARYDGPASTVSGLAWSSNGKYLAAGDGNGMLRIWNVPTNTLIVTAHIHTERIWWITWSPDGKYIASASADNTVQIWNINTQTPSMIYTGHTNIVYEVTWSPDGKYLVSSGKDATAQVWNAASGKILTTYQGHTDEVLAAVWSPDGKYIASSSADGTVQIWNAFTGQMILTYRGHVGKVWSVSWSNNNQIASASQDGTIQVWQAPT
jgi:WD40 repeat protein/DNA-binding XRE family transcriptional regulator